MDEKDILICGLLEKINDNSRKGHKEFFKFINENFIPHNSKKCYLEIKRNVKYLESMEKEDVLFVKARLKQIEEDNDPSKYFPTLLGIFGFVTSLYSIIRIYSKNDLLAVIINIIVLSFLAIYLVRVFFNTTKRRNSIIYFNEIFKNIIFEEGKDDN